MNKMVPALTELGLRHVTWNDHRPAEAITGIVYLMRPAHAKYVVPVLYDVALGRFNSSQHRSIARSSRKSWFWGELQCEGGTLPSFRKGQLQQASQPRQRIHWLPVSVFARLWWWPFEKVLAICSPRCDLQVVCCIVGVLLFCLEWLVTIGYCRSSIWVWGSRICMEHGLQLHDGYHDFGPSQLGFGDREFQSFSRIH